LKDGYSHKENAHNNPTKHNNPKAMRVGALIGHPRINSSNANIAILDSGSSETEKETGD
jgi:hypothetical protein